MERKNKKNKNYSNKKHNKDFSKNQNKREKANQSLPKIILDSPIWPRCKQPIQELASALTDKKTGEPMHFDCVLDFLKASENLEATEKITYIGQGRFAIAHFPTPHDFRHFEIRKIIEWEEKEKDYEWRSNIANLFSKI